MVKKNTKWSASSSIEAAPNITNTSSDGKDMEPKRTHGYLKRTSETLQKYSKSIKEEQNCSNETPTNTPPPKPQEICLPTTPDKPHLTLTSTTLIESHTPPSTKKKTHNPYPYYPLDHQPQDPLH